MKHYLYVGDNQKVLTNNNFKNQYENHIDLIYIDPPYNTGNKFSYNDKRDVNDYCEWMKDLFSLSLPLMKETAPIFISCDDNSLTEILIAGKIVFGLNNYLGIFITNQSKRSNSKHINITQEYIVVFCKNKKALNEFKILRTNIPQQNKIINELNDKLKNFKTIEEKRNNVSKIVDKICERENITWLKNYKYIDDEGQIYFPHDLSTPGNSRKVNLPEINLYLEPLKNRGWSSDKVFIELANQNRLVFRNNRPYKKVLLSESYDCVDSQLNFYSRQGTEDLKRCGLEKLFDTPKPIEMIKYLIRITGLKNGNVLDFFAGSGTTACACIELNQKEKFKLNSISIQLPEQIKIKNDYDFKTIDEITKYRIETYINDDKNNNMEIICVKN